MSETALKISNLVKRYGDKRVVDDLSFSIEKGEIFALLGPNGAGKSTTINMTVGLANITAGQVEVFGKDVQKESSLSRRMIGIMHQEVVFDNFFSVQKSLEMHSGFYGKKTDKSWVEYIIEKLSLSEHRHKKPLMLSGGMKRRLMLAKALMHKPPLLILDEPTAGVDVELRHSLWDFVVELNQKESMTILLTTHYLEEAEKLCRRIAIIDRGKLVALDTKDSLLAEQKSSSLEEVFLKLTKRDAGV